MTRGFITIATGRERFYRIAANLLTSYRLFSESPLPFAILCDRENRWTKLFDDVVILKEPKCSYLDKLYLPDMVPYDETVFIDADCLAYRDLNVFFEHFPKEDSFSAFGTVLDKDCTWGWFKKENAGKYRESIRFIPEFTGGVYFLRRSPGLSKLGQTSREILTHYHEFSFRQFTEPADEPIFALAMAAHGQKPVDRRKVPVCIYYFCEEFRTNLQKGEVSYSDRWHPEEGTMENAYMIHWGSGNTQLPVYRIEADKARILMRKKMKSRTVRGGDPAGGHRIGALRLAVSAAWIRLTYALRRAAKGILKKTGLRK